MYTLRSKYENICFVADTKDKNHLSATSLLLDLERPVWRHESPSENSQIRVHRAGE